MRVRTIALAFCFLMSWSIQAQKVKYKDLYELLRTKQYDLAEPFLRQYLQTESDNPNAILYMGIILDEKSVSLDPLKETENALATFDSAMLFYGKAKTAIDEKEIKKNKDYYEIYLRRDLRTGQMGVSLSDVQLDLDKRIAAVRERATNVKLADHFFRMSSRLYDESQTGYKNLQSSVPDIKALHLRADEQTLAALNLLGAQFDSCTLAYSNYKIAISNLGKTGYNPSGTLIPIQDFKTDGTTGADFFADDLKMWDYKKFATSVSETITKNVIPLRDKFVAFDMEINKLKEKLASDSVSVMSEIGEVRTKLQSPELTTYDKSPFPLDLFALKIADLEYKSIKVEHSQLRDSASLFLKESLFNKELAAAKNLDSTARNINARNLEEDIPNYEHFVTSTYHNATLLRSYLNAVAEYAKLEVDQCNALLEQVAEAKKWIVDENDSIPVSREVVSATYSLLVLEEEKFTAGIAIGANGVSGYFYKINPARKPAFKVKFPVSDQFKTLNRETFAGLAASDPDGLIYYVLVNAMQKEGVYPSSLAKIYSSDGLSWSKNFNLDFAPSEISYDPSSGELHIKNGEKVVRFDKNGNKL